MRAAGLGFSYSLSDDSLTERFTTRFLGLTGVSSSSSSDKGVLRFVGTLAADFEDEAGLLDEAAALDVEAALLAEAVGFAGAFLTGVGSGLDSIEMARFC